MKGPDKELHVNWGDPERDVEVVEGRLLPSSVSV